MDQHDDQLTRTESLRIIDSMISVARNQMNDNGHLYLLWGWVILVCSVGQYLMQYVFSIANYWMIWMLTWAALIYQVIYIKQKQKKKRVQNYTDEILKYVWIVFIILMVLMAVFLSRVVQRPEQINVAVLVLYGMPTLLSGIILKFKPLVAGGIGCWVLSLLSMFIPYQYYTLLVGLAVIIAWIIPGFLLQSKYKKLNAGL